MGRAALRLSGIEQGPQGQRILVFARRVHVDDLVDDALLYATLRFHRGFSCRPGRHVECRDELWPGVKSEFYLSHKAPGNEGVGFVLGTDRGVRCMLSLQYFTPGCTPLCCAKIPAHRALERCAKPDVDIVDKIQFEDYVCHFSDGRAVLVDYFLKHYLCGPT